MTSSGSPQPVRIRSTPAEIVSHVLLRCAIVGGVLGLAGYTLRAESWTDPTLGNILVDLSDTVYRTIRLFLFVSEFPRAADEPSLRWTISTALLHGARFLAPIAFYGMLSRALLGLLRPQLQRYRLARLKGHTIVCGLGEVGRQFVLDLMRADPQAARRYVAIESRSVESMRAFAEPLGIELIEASSREARSLLRANVRDASRIVIVTDDDSANLDAAALLPALVERRALKAPLEAYMEVRNDTLLNELTNRDAFLRPSEKLELRPFNLDVLVARRFFADHNLMEEASLRDQRRVHLLFAGFDSVALQLMLQLARIAPYRDLLRPLVTILAPAPEDCREALSATYPELAGEISDQDKVIELKLERWAAEEDGLPQALMAAVEAEDEITAIVVCLGEDALNARTALLIRSLSQREARWRAPIFVHQRGLGGFGRFVQESVQAKEFVAVIEPFGMLDAICRVEDLSRESDTTARLLHEGYLAQRGARRSDEPQPSLKPWPKLDEIYRRANRRAADHIPVKLASAGFHVTGRPFTRRRGKPLGLSAEEMRALARLEHESWMNGQKLAGWRRGTERDDERRYHEFLVPFDALPKAIQDYDVEQVELVTEKIVSEADPDAVTVYRERRIGLLAEPQLSAEEEAAALRELSERTLPALLARFQDDWLTLMTQLMPATELPMCEAIISALDAKKRKAWRLIILEGMPERIAFGRAASLERKSGDREEDKAYSGMIDRRRALIARPETEWIVNLTPPALRLEDWLRDASLRPRGRARARDYLMCKCELIIAAESQAARALGPSEAALPASGQGIASERLIRLPAQ